MRISRSGFPVYFQKYLDAANLLLNELFQDNFVENNITSPEILKTYRLKIGYLIENLK